MILVVLFTLLLLAGILAATLRLGLGSRQNTADQAATLRAQYAAESGMAVMTQRLRDYQTILSPTRPGPNSTTITNILVPPSTTKAELQAYAEQFCNYDASTNTWATITEFNTARSEQDSDIFTDAKQCTVNSIANNPNQFQVLADIITPEAYETLELSTERPSDTNDEDVLKAWWKTLLTTERSGTNWKLNLRALRVVQLTPTRYRFYFGVLSAKTRGQENSTQRILAASRASNGIWWIEVQLPNLLEDVLMTNHHRAKPGIQETYDPAGAPGVNFTSQRFDGSVHTNEKYLFDNASSAVFLDKVSSVGCTDLPENGRPESGDCEKKTGVYIRGLSGPQTPPDSANSDEDRDKYLANLVVSSPRTVNFVKSTQDTTKIDYTKTDFTAAYKPLPENENDQIAAAKDSGLYFGASVESFSMKAADSSGNPLSNYANGRWGETSGNIYQYITITRKEITNTRKCNTGSWSYADKKSGRNYTPTAAYNSTPDYIEGNRARQTITVYGKTRYQIRAVTCYNVPSETLVSEEYRYGPDMVLKKKPAIGNWSSATTVRSNFNGVIYAPNFSNISGPTRIGNDTTGALDKAPPALASFAKITLAASDDIAISSDLTMSETPCTFSETKATPPCKRKPSNVLGIYSQNGDIVFKNPSPKNINIHAAMIASTGQATVENYDTRPQNGNVKLIGSLIENWYGAFGTYGGSGGDTGYGRDFTYDSRLNSGITPPFFPVSPRWNVQPASEISSNRLFNIIPINVKATSF
ncbi:hypothetical protein Dcar01_02294 [Deinococcus carri]|uniref:DUF4900 domain-containing protein n=1 Tax=Deinococcus carri TaxID=1211323 RepID=A0ABP9W877_9DEIO